MALIATFLLGLTPAVSIAAACTTSEATGGGYKYVAFKSAGVTCTWDRPLGVTQIDLLVVGGGGGGGSRHSGGGGAGGYISASAVSLSGISVLQVVVGAGGAGGTAGGNGSQGSDSSVSKSTGTGSFTTRTALGGGYGGATGATGGSGGGSYWTGASGTAGQGNAGGSGGTSASAYWYAGGGGGAGASGSNGTTSGGGAGGAGLQWSTGLTSSIATSLGLTDTTGYFAGGGGGGITINSGTVNGGAGGVGGGGNGGGSGSSSACGVAGAKGCNGIANTGGGGGGQGLNQVTQNQEGGTGGSGVVILRYSTTLSTELALDKYGVAASCGWDTRQNYATLFQAGTTNTIVQARHQFEASALDGTFNATKIEIYSNNAGAAGTLIGTLRPSTLAAASTQPGASLATRVGTYTGSINVTAGTQYWYAVIGSSNVLSMCASTASVTGNAGWSLPLSGGNYYLRTNGSYGTWPALFQFEISVGAPDVTAPIITGPNADTGASVTVNQSENAPWSNTYTANEWVAWSITGADSATFTLTSAGVLSLGAKNFEVRSDANSDGTFQVTISATDSAGNASTQSLSLIIDDADDTPVITINSGSGTHGVSVNENQTSVITYTGTDEDVGASLNWFFADSAFDVNKFNLDLLTGVLTFKVAPNFESPTDTNGDNVYKVNILLYDGFNFTTQTLSVTVLDVAENSTLNSPTVSASAYKGVSISITVTGSTPGKVRFFIDGKKIPTCLNVPTTGSAPTVTAVCTFKPAVQGRHSITARLTPTNNGLTASTSGSLSLFVGRRTTTR